MESTPRRIFAIGDIHLNFDLVTKAKEKYPGFDSNPSKKIDYLKITKDMTFWGDEWKNHTEVLQQFWDKNVNDKDIVIIAGDVSWTKNIKKEGDKDLLWIQQRPGIKIICKGNHDYWFKSRTSFVKELEEKYGMHFLTAENEYCDDDVIIGGTALCDFNFNVWPPINPQTFVPEPLIVPFDEGKQKEELAKLDVAIKRMTERCKRAERLKIIVLHHPPFNENGDDSEISKKICEFSPNFCVFGHIHTLPRLYHLEEYKTFDDIVNRFNGCHCCKGNTCFQLVSSDVRNHQLVLIKEIENSKLLNQTSRAEKKRKRKERIKKEKELNKMKQIDKNIL
ncbi:hypothetical protein ENUP19_0054G0056 [Entamoeba nuttalli]|uniref:Ser/thr protein phosphatase family protein n=2 Tax=Entamoeba nuttalli TaxID=412467 RepID=K2HIA2_ENTNP|nr:ser/thr protein phosphatase family protein [Entamoeba nuttalli P19]EKE42729.1 ser/thr protein phosphatase family protein [Entamoeba nuttalli P19]|eukprot:XP_008854935.1 ser/thr protein phosphatase family protein [Entamoeba nuttalli P19]